MIDHIPVITLSHPFPPSRLLPLRTHANRSAQNYYSVVEETPKRNSTQHKYFHTRTSINNSSSDNIALCYYHYYYYFLKSKDYSDTIT